MKKVKTLLAATIMCACCTPAWAQQSMTWDTFIEQMLAEGEEDELLTEERYEQLEHLHAHPMNLNQASKEDLLQLPFLTEEQAADIVFYCTVHGPMLSTGELMFIESLGRREREWLQLFCYAAPMPKEQHLTVGNLMKHLKNELSVRADIPLYYKAGQLDYAEETLRQYPNRKYRGDALHTSLRYALSSMNHVYVGLQMEKDAGERGLDYLAGYLMLKNLPTGRRSQLKEAIVGNYRASFGLGLAVNTAVGFGKTMMLSNLSRIDRGFSKHASTMESGYLQGAALRYQYGAVTMAAFGSWQRADATLRSDSAGLSALKTDGLHRTPLEHSKRHNIGLVNYGANVHWEYRSLQLSATAVATHFTVPLSPSWNTPSTAYRRYNAQGQDFQVYSLSYTWRWRSLQITGEGAVSHANGLVNGKGRQAGTATLHAIRYKVNGQNELLAVARYYGAKFTSINGKTFGENARPQNEGGVMLSWQTTMLPNVCIDATIDWMYFPWLKYGVGNRSQGIDGMVQATFSPSRRSSWLVRYRVKSKEKDYRTADGEAHLLHDKRHTLKLQHSISLGQAWTLKTTVNGCLIHFGPDSPEIGFSVGENIRWTVLGGKLRLDASLCYFHTDSYNARVYSYEPSLLYSFGLMSYFHKGFRGSMMLNWQVAKGLNLTAKIGTTHYLDQDTIGTGTELIATSHKEDLQLMARWRF